jgi:DUF4097 and DUF4098 domain-containing protein YvlB
MTVMTKLRIVSKSGNVTVRAEPGAGLDVSGGTITIDADGTNIVSTRGKSVDVRCEAGTDVMAGTISGSITLIGTFGEVRAATKSGSIDVDAARSLDARTHSGSVSVGTCDADCRIVVTSGKIAVGRAARASLAGVSGSVRLEETDAADVKTVSGTVSLGCSCTGRVAIRSISGTVDIDVPTDRMPATRLKSISGKIRCDCDQGTDGEIDVKTISGRIQVNCK